jgi:hypothetical protein
MTFMWRLRFRYRIMKLNALCWVLEKLLARRDRMRARK